MTLIRHAEGLFTAWAPLSFYGIHVGTRMTVVRLPSGGLLVHSPIALEPELKTEVEALGDVTQIVAPNLFHHLAAGAWAEAYPKAVVHAPRSLRKKRADLRIDRELEEASAKTFEDALVPLAIDGTMLRETVFVHGATRSVLSVDLVENFITSDHWPTRWYLKIGGIHGKPGWNRFLRFIYKDKKAARTSIDRLLEHDFDRVLLAHGEVIESNAKDTLREALSFVA
jgi:hypothetical protein